MSNLASGTGYPDPNPAEKALALAFLGILLAMIVLGALDGQTVS